MLYILHAVGAPRCQKHFANCTDGCSPVGSFDGVPPETYQLSRSRISYDDFLDSAMLGMTISGMQAQHLAGWVKVAIMWSFVSNSVT